MAFFFTNILLGKILNGNDICRGGLADQKDVYRITASFPSSTSMSLTEFSRWEKLPRGMFLRDWEEKRPGKELKSDGEMMQLGKNNNTFLPLGLLLFLYCDR